MYVGMVGPKIHKRVVGDKMHPYYILFLFSGNSVSESIDMDIIV